MPDAGTMRARYRRILRFSLRHMLLEWWFELFLPRIGLERFAARGRAARLQRIAQRFHVLAVDLGGLMIKVGQFLSSRLDVLPPEITDELAGLQDEVPPVPFEQARALAEAELGMPLARAYAWVDPVPIAAASLGQAHRVRLTERDAADVGVADAVVKIQRPGIDEIVAVDLTALRRVARWLARVRLIADRVDLPALVEEFAATSLEEIDYLHEAQNAERFAADIAADPRVDAPDVVWERTTRRVLTLADVTAIKITDRETLLAAGIDPAEVAREFAGVMFDQLFRTGFFHADPHPGNVFVTPRDGEDTPDAPAWRLTFIDFGMMGEVPDTLRAGLRTLLVAVAARDGRGLVQSIQQVGMLLPSADTAELERAMSTLFSRFGGMGFGELQQVDPREFRDFADQFGELARSLPFQLPENFLLIIRAVSLISGICSALDPAFNIWDAVEPYAASLMRDERGPVVRAFARDALEVAGLAARLPRRIDATLSRVEEGTVAVAAPALERRMARLERVGRRVVSAILFATLFLGGILLLGFAPAVGWVVLGVSVLPLLHALLASRLGP